MTDSCSYNIVNNHNYDTNIIIHIDYIIPILFPNPPYKGGFGREPWFPPPPL